MIRHRKTKTLWMFTVIYSLLIGTSVPAFSESEDSSDFGMRVQRLLQDQANHLFGGIVKPLDRSADDTVFTGPGDRAVLAAKGLSFAAGTGKKE